MPNGIFSLKQQVLAIREGGWPGQKPLAVDYLVVAGGGATTYIGGGGAGGLLQGNIPVATGSSITVTVGAGGTSTGASPTNGSNSVFGSITAIGGGAYGSSGGSGGGSGYNDPGGQGVANQGNTGGSGTWNSGGAGEDAGGGGGGAGTRGLTGVPDVIGGNGGAGVASDISGTRTVYAGGGGGCLQSGLSGGTGGVGGGGNGATGGAGTANTGGGAGAPGFGGNANGGSGIVILSYPDIYAAAASTTGSPTVSTSGSGSLFFNGGSVLYLGYGAQTPFSFGTGDFTIEFWYYNTSVTTTILADWRAGGTNGAYPTIYISGTSPVYYVSGADRITGNALANSTWYHIAVCRTGTSTKMYVNGTQVGSTYTDSTNYIVNTNGPSIGNPTGVATGYMSNVRIAKGVCVYTGNFTVPTSPLTATQPAGTNISAITGTQTSLLLNTVSGALFADSSTNGYAATVTGSTISWNSLSPFATGLGYKNRVYTWTSSGSITF